MSLRALRLTCTATGGACVAQDKLRESGVSGEIEGLPQASPGRQNLLIK